MNVKVLTFSGDNICRLKTDKPADNGKHNDSVFFFKNKSYFWLIGSQQGVKIESIV